jgi:predicted transcriptional regulator
LSSKDTQAIVDSLEEVKELHRRFQRAVNNPIRRKMLSILMSGAMSLQDLKSKMGLDEKTFKWHLDFLEYGHCVEKKVKADSIIYKITQYGKVIDYLKSTL